MPLPFFFEDEIPSHQTFELSEDSSRHVVQVLRMSEGEKLMITNGKGQVLTADIKSVSKKSTIVSAISMDQTSSVNKTTIGISLLKTDSRFEWFLEKATEIGIEAIIPLLCERTAKQNFRLERMKKILISAMLQSQQSWLPKLHPATKFSDVIRMNYDAKFIATCSDDEKKLLTDEVKRASGRNIILIGPEGDFSPQEITSSKENNFIPVSLGNTRLRTETAGIYSAVIMQAQ
jgi:16S rRNA (uracil1498-N3)-methyltransferase